MTLEYVGGRLRAPARTIGQLHDPNTGEPRRQQLASDERSVGEALEAAEIAHESGEWRHATWAARDNALAAFSVALTERSEQLAQADAEQTGVPIGVTRELVAEAVSLPAVMGSMAESILHERLSEPHGDVHQHWLPLGPAAVITPWNAPTSIALGKISFALAAGAPVILKPSEFSPGSASIIGQAAHEAGLPVGTLQVLQGAADVASLLVQDERIAAVSLTGSLQAGLSVARAAAPRLVPTDLELSGNNPALILPGANLRNAARALVQGMIVLNGQWCSAPRRVLVPTDQLDEIRDLTLTGLEHLRIGPSTHEGSELGPLINHVQLERLQRQIGELESLGAKAFRAGETPVGSGGYFTQPAVLTNAPPAGREELFGPVIQLLGYSDVAEAIQIANDHPYGLAAYVFGPDTAYAEHIGLRLRAGLVRINAVGPGLPAMNATCGIWGDSGHGSVGLRASLRFFTGARCVG